MNETPTSPVSIHTFFKSSKAWFIGVSNYTSPAISNLNSPENDIERLKRVLEDQHGFIAEPPLFDPDDKTFLDFLDNIKVDKRDRTLIYIACHGIAVNGDGDPEGYLLAKNSVPGDWDTFIKMSEVTKRLNALESDHLLVILDCCYSGAFRWSQQTRAIGLEVPKTIYYERFKQYVEYKAWQVFTSAAHDQLALDILRLGNREESGKDLSPFASLLIDALENGSADLSYGCTPADGVITATELMFYIREEIFKHLYQLKIPVDKQQVPMIFSLGTANKGEFVFLSPKKVRDDEVILLRQTNENPYKGLESYTEKDSVIFYGRKRVLEGWELGGLNYPGLKEVIKKHALTIVAGPSGCGKTSLVKAGILSMHPEHARQIRPGKTPFATHAAYLKEIEEATEPKILLIDQYEELITVCTNETERVSFELLVLSLLEKHKVILTIRSDFESQFRTSIVFCPTTAERARFLVPAFLRSEIGEIVEQPALQEVLEFKSIKGTEQANDAFVNRIIDDAFQNPGSLPLLSLTLMELYERKDNRDLLEHEYDKFGGIGGILDVKVTAAWQMQGSDLERTLFQKLIFRLISLEGGRLTKRRIVIGAKDDAPDELHYPNVLFTNKIKEIADKLVEMRLLTTDVDEDGQRFIEPVHDAFLRTSLILGWLKTKDPGSKLNNEDKVKLLYRISDISRTYNNDNGEDRKYYLWVKDPRLELVEKELMDYLNVTEKTFIDNSGKRKRRSKIIGQIGIAASLLLAFGFAVYFWNQANVLQKEVNKRKALNLLTNVDTFTPTEGIRRLEYAYSLDTSSTLLKDKLSELYAKSDWEIAFSFQELPLERPLSEYYPMGKNVLVRYGKDKVVLLDSLGKIKKSPGVNGAILAAPNQRFISFTDKEGTGQLLDTGGNVVWQSKEPIAYPSFSDDGRFLLLLNSRGTGPNEVDRLKKVTIVDLKTNKEQQIQLEKGPDIRYQGEIVVYYLPEPKQLLVGAAKNGRMEHFLFDTNGKLLKTYREGLLKVNLNAGKILLAFPDRFELQDYKTNATRVIKELKPAGKIWGDISNDGNLVAIVAGGNYLWMDLRKDLFFKRGSLGISGKIDSNRLTTDGKYLLSFTENYIDRLDLQSGAQLRIAYSLAEPTEEFQKPATVSAFSGDNYLVFNNNSQVLIDIRAGLAKKISNNNKQSRFAGISGDTLMFLSPNNKNIYRALKNQFGSCLAGLSNTENNLHLELLKEENKLLVLRDQPNVGIAVNLKNNQILRVAAGEKTPAFHLKNDYKRWFTPSNDGVSFYKNGGSQVFYPLKNQVKTDRDDVRDWRIHYSRKYGKAIAVPELQRGVFIDLNQKSSRLYPIELIPQHQYCFFQEQGFLVMSKDSLSYYTYQKDPQLMKKKTVKIPGNSNQSSIAFNDGYNDSTMVRYNSDSLTFQTITGKENWTRSFPNKRIDRVFYIGEDHLAVSTSNKYGKTMVILDRNEVPVMELNYNGSMPKSLRYDAPGGRLYYLKDDRLYVKYTHKAVLLALKDSGLPLIAQKRME